MARGKDSQITARNNCRWRLGLAQILTMSRATEKGIARRISEAH